MKRISNSAALTNSKFVPTGRSPLNNLARDIEFRKGVKRLVDAGVITENTLVISDTGHDIPMLAELLSTELKTQYSFYFPKELNDEIVIKRLLNQLFDAKAELRQTKDKPHVYFIGLEVHRENYGKPYYRINPEMLPSEKELIAAGVTQVIYLYEISFDQDLNDMISDDLLDYFDRFKVIPLQAHPTDCQRMAEC